MIHVRGPFRPSQINTNLAPATHFRAQLQLDAISVPDRDEEVWILLTRHLRSHRAQNEYIALTAHSGDSTGSALGNNVLSTKVSSCIQLDIIVVFI